MDEKATRLSEARADERTRYYAAKRSEERIRSDERRLMFNRGRTHDRGDLTEHWDDSGFTPGENGLI